MTPEQKLLVVLMTEARETKVRAWVSQKLVERMLLRHGEDLATLTELVAQLKDEADSTFLRESISRLKQMFPDDQDFVDRFFGQN